MCRLYGGGGIPQWWRFRFEHRKPSLLVHVGVGAAAPQPLAAGVGTGLGSARPAVLRQAALAAAAGRELPVQRGQAAARPGLAPQATSRGTPRQKRMSRLAGPASLGKAQYRQVQAHQVQRSLGEPSQRGVSPQAQRQRPLDDVAVAAAHTLPMARRRQCSCLEPHEGGEEEESD